MLGGTSLSMLSVWILRRLEPEYYADTKWTPPTLCGWATLGLEGSQKRWGEVLEADPAA